MSDEDSQACRLARMLHSSVNCMPFSTRATLLHGATMALRHINCVIEMMEHCAQMYGSAEALEFQFLTMVEVRQMILRPKANLEDPIETAEAYRVFLRALNGEETCTYLHVLLREEGRLDELPRLLGDFGRWLWQEYPPEVPT